MVFNKKLTLLWGYKQLTKQDSSETVTYAISLNNVKCIIVSGYLTNHKASDHTLNCVAPSTMGKSNFTVYSYCYLNALRYFVIGN